MAKPIAKITHLTGVKVPDLVELLKKGEKEILVKTVIGSATNLSKRKGPDGEKMYEGLMGSFRSYFPDGEIENSDVLFFPEGTLEKFLAPFRSNDPPKALDLGIEVYINKANSEAGYAWSLKPVLAEVNTADPVDLVRQKLAGKIKGDKTIAKPDKK